MPYATAICQDFPRPRRIPGSISPFEFNLDKAAERIWYDISKRRCIPERSTSLHGGRYAATTISEKIAAHPIYILVHCPKGEQICNGAYNLPDDTRTLLCPNRLVYAWYVAQEANLRLQLANRERGGRPVQGGSPVRRPTLTTTGRAKVLGNNAKRSSEKHDSVRIGGLT